MAIIALGDIAHRARGIGSDVTKLKTIEPVDNRSTKLCSFTDLVGRLSLAFNKHTINSIGSAIELFFYFTFCNCCNKLS